MKTVLLIAALAGVTYLPRLIPFLGRGLRIPRRLEKFLYAVPYAVLGALIFPDSLTAWGTGPLEIGGASAALAVAALTAWFTRNILLTFAAGTALALFWRLFFS